MGFFDDAGATISGAIDSAKDAVGGAVEAAEGGLAEGLSAVEDAASGIAGGIGNAVGDIGGAIGGAIGGIGGAIGGALGGLAGGIGGALGGLAGALGSLGKPTNLGLPLPLPNPLFNYASYNYIIGLSSISMDSYKNPDTTYMKGKGGTIICKSGSVSPDNRVNTPWGAFEFYIEDVELQSQIGHEQGSNNNLVGKVKFKIIEPYSMGMLFNALQIAAQDHHKGGNWRDTPFLLSIEFKGNSETGSLLNVPGCNRYIPIKLINCFMKVNEQGAVYDIEAQPYNVQALMDYNSKLKGDHSARGSTVQEMLQSGPKSLQAVINARLKQVADATQIKVPDKVIILFPVDGAASSDFAKGAATGEDTPTVDVTKTDTGLYSLLGVVPTQTDPDNLVQYSGSINPIGKSKLKFNDDHKGDTPVGKDQKIYDEEGKNVRRGANTTNTKESDMKFSQDTDVTNAINQVIMMSDFVDKTLDPSNLSPEGYRNWWSIHTQTYPLEQNGKGETAKVHVYRVIPYKVHTSSAPTPANVKPIGYKSLAKQAVKEYNYIYTGKNIDVIKFEINFKYNFYNSVPADGYSGSIDAKTAANQSPASKGSPQSQPLSQGKEPETEPGYIPTIIRHDSTKSNSDKLGGGGVETQSTRVGRYFHDSITQGNDMMNLVMDIIGDPYYIVQSGTGNYVSKASEHVNLCADGSINHLNGEVDIMVNFRNPVDINQTTGLYDFGKSSPIKQFSGLYQVLMVTSKFQKNHFTQQLKLRRRKLYEAKVESTKDQMYGNKTGNNPKDPANRDNANANANSSGPENLAGLPGIQAGLAEAQQVIGQATGAINKISNLTNQASALTNVAKGIGKLF